jgi:hypothetical protein
MIPMFIFINIKKIRFVTASKSVGHHGATMCFVFAHWILIRVNIVKAKIFKRNRKPLTVAFYTALHNGLVR